MKKLLFLVAFTGGLLVFASQNAVAQEESPTSKTATKDKGYTVLNTGEAITIYKYVHTAHSQKEAEKFAPRYFFSLKSTDVLQELTMTNLKKAFPENHAFHDALDVNFKEDKELISYDEFHKIYKLNWILKNNIN